MTEKLATSGRLRVEIDIYWPYTFDEKATAKDIYVTVARECENILRSALTAANVRHEVFKIEPIMIIYPTQKPNL